jgi:hypothetical protein
VTQADNPWNVSYKLASDKMKNNTILTTLKKPDFFFTRDLKETMDTMMNQFPPTDDEKSDSTHQEES